MQGRTHDSTVLTIRRFADMYRRAKRFSDAEHQLLPIATSLLASSNADKRSVDIVIKELAALYHERGKSRQASEWRAKLAK